VWPALLVCGGSFALVQFLVANFVGPELVDVLGGLISLIFLTLFLRIWQPKEAWRFADEHAARPESPLASKITYTTGQVVSAWVPWVLLTLFVLVWGIPQVKGAMGAATAAEKKAFGKTDETLEVRPTTVLVQVPHLHRRIARDAPVVKEREIEPAIYEFNWLSATGTGIFFAAIVSAFWLRISPLTFVVIFRKTCWSMRWPLFTIACMLAIAYTTRYSGMDATMGLAFTRTGSASP
jgi:lactate permease